MDIIRYLLILTAIPGNEDIWYQVISVALTVIAAIIAWFRNNYVTAKRKKQ